jgi:DNA-binding response OmpR family regulator
MNTYKILIVEDETHIAQGLKLNLELKGYQTVIAEDGEKALLKHQSERPHLILLDLMLPKIDGFKVLEEIRKNDEHTPIFVLSARFETSDKIRCFQSGVDDYLAKPFNLEEFLLRVDRLLDRTQLKIAVKQTKEYITFNFGQNTVDFQNLSAKTENGNINLTAQECDILQHFIRNEGKILSRAEILENALGYENPGKTRTIDNFIVRFRKYFESAPSAPVHFKSIRSKGYVFYSR